jgi:hypothetical protein
MSSVFLSHNSTDKPLARKLAQDLVLRGVRVWLDEAELVVGDSLLQKIASAIEEMDYLAVLLSPASVSSAWVYKELEIAIARQLMTGGVKVLPVIVAPCEVPAFLRDTFYVRMDTEENYASGLRNLMRRLLPSVPYDPSPDPTFPPDAGFDWVRNPKRRVELLSTDANDRKRALRTLRGTALVIPLILELLIDESPDVTAAALEALRHQPSTESFWALEANSHEDPFGRHHPVNEILAPIYDYLESNRLPRQTTHKLFNLLSSPDETLSAIATFSLAASGMGEAIPRFISSVFVEERDLIREISVWGLAKGALFFPNDTRIKNALLVASNDLIGSVRERAEKALQRYGVKSTSRKRRPASIRTS